MQKELITVIIPVYKVESFLDRCITSIVNQTYRNMEIILVDDGSPDRCPEICDAWQRKDDRIKVIHKENNGVGMARNTGLDNAKGEYVFFVDSDDYVHQDMVKLCFESAKKESADVVHFGFYTVNSNNRINGTIRSEKEMVYRGQSVRAEFIPAAIGADPLTGKSSGIRMSLCSCLISRALIDQINWRCVSEREIFSEDVYSLLNLYGFAKCIVVLNHALYYYCENRASQSRQIRIDRYKRIKSFYCLCISSCDVQSYGEEIKRRLTEPFLNFTIAAAKQITVCNKHLPEKIRMLKDIINDDILQKVLSETVNDKRNIKLQILFYLWRHHFIILSFVLLRLKVK